MGDAAIRSLLESKDHGVLSMGADNRGYGLPVAFNYDETADRIVIGFVEVPDSKKQKFAADTEEVTLTVYEFEDVDSWKSVVATGTLHRVDDAALSEELYTLFFFREDDETGDREMFDFDEYDRVWYELRIRTLSGLYTG
ncbi:MAG: pyridoxamine 5'-phosphate oxidase family protein [Halanaeroarchaeum sp.]